MQVSFFPVSFAPGVGSPGEKEAGQRRVMGFRLPIPEGSAIWKGVSLFLCVPREQSKCHWLDVIEKDGPWTNTRDHFLFFF